MFGVGQKFRQLPCQPSPPPHRPFHTRPSPATACICAPVKWFLWLKSRKLIKVYFQHKQQQQHWAGAGKAVQGAVLALYGGGQGGWGGRGGWERGRPANFGQKLRHMLRLRLKLKLKQNSGELHSLWPYLHRYACLRPGAPPHPPRMPRARPPPPQLTCTPGRAGREWITATFAAVFWPQNFANCSSVAAQHGRRGEGVSRG